MGIERARELLDEFYAIDPRSHLRIRFIRKVLAFGFRPGSQPVSPESCTAFLKGTIHGHRMATGGAS